MMISEYDLLQRRERVLDPRPVAEWLKNKRVAVTGAAGYIGSELARQVLTFNPASLIGIDNREEGLWRIARDGIETVFADIRDSRRLRHVLRGVDVVFHAAAMKHVPICESSPEDAWFTNSAGTRHVVDCAPGARVVLVSTDKAVRPTSVLGKTKQLAENIVIESGRGVVVRFGNVIGSTGSVVPLWREQIAAGGPVTLTDPEMTRYFMTVGEAAELILQAGALGPGIYVLDMSDPVRILDLATDMIRLSGRKDIEIKVTGIRGGEKLHEQLAEEPLVPSGVDGVMRVVG